MPASATMEEELKYFRTLRPEIKSLMQKYGAIILRDFEITKTTDGFLKL